MKFTETNLKDCYLIEPLIFSDERGYFFESFKRSEFLKQTGSDVCFVQDNESMSKYGVIRGLHMQLGEFSQAKLVRVLHGKILDVVVDVRKNSPTFGQHIAVELDSEQKNQLFVPKNFLHGFSVLSEEAVVHYKCDSQYEKSAEEGVHPLDLELNIDWKIPVNAQIISEKDQMAKSFTDFKKGLR